MKPRTLLLLVLAVARVYSANAAEGDPSSTVLELCTSEMKDVLPTQLFRFTVSRTADRYSANLVRLYDNDKLHATSYWEVGVIEQPQFDKLLRAIRDLHPESMQSVFPAPGHDLGSPQSWVLLQLESGNTVELFFPVSPAGETEAAAPVPRAARELLKLLWQSRGLATETRMVNGAPPDFRGHCFRPSTQQRLNRLLRAADIR
jgi:hypothetical protein